MIIAMWFAMVLAVVLVGFAVLGVVFTHYFKQWRAQKKTEAQNVSKGNTATS